MSDILVYWWGYSANWPFPFEGERAFCRHSSAKCIAELQPGDRMWMVTSGKGLRVLRQGEAAIAGPAGPAG